jgi:hypothetical protein
LPRFRHLTKAALLALAGSVGASLLPAVAQAAGPRNTAPPGIVGTPELGQTLTEVQGQWQGEDFPASLTVQWEDCTDGTAST